MIKKIYYSIILFGYGTKTPLFLKFLNIQESQYQIESTDKLQYLLKLIMTFTPVAYILNAFNAWFPDNQVFFRVLIWAVLANILAGGWLHHKNGTFKIKILLLKNIEMCIIILITYPILEGINKITGDNVAGKLFQWAIQIGTILYPGSKAIKNIHILSNKKYPPEFIMNKIYNFEKDGDVTEFLGNKPTEPTNNENLE